MTEQTSARRLVSAILTTVVAAIGVCATTIAIGHPTAHATSFADIVGPAGSGGFGTFVEVLSNGNFVVVDHLFDLPGQTDVGAVYLYNGATREPIRRLTGTNAGDKVGSYGIVEVGSSNFVVISPSWKNAGASTAGAVTWVDGQFGLEGEVTVFNSLTGSQAGDQVGSGGVQRLTSGHYVVRSPNWKNNIAANAGAVTWGNGTFGTTGAVGAGNSIVGSTTNDRVGNREIAALSDGDYVVASPSWNNVGAPAAGAATWGNGVGGSSGVVSAANSLVGTRPGDSVGEDGVAALTNGNYVVASGYWNTALVLGVGAATLGMGDGSTKGPVTSANSWLGTKMDDNVGGNGVTPLTNGNYVVASPQWDDGGVIDAGAATWGDGDGGTMGAVSSTNSLVGTVNEDFVAYGDVVALANGNYAVSSTQWNGAGANRGAVTWGNGTIGMKGTINNINSLIGTQDNDQIGTHVEPLTNGNYVVTSQFWQFGGNPNAGAATFAKGDGSTHGTISAGNSLIGVADEDRVGSAGAVALSNGNYVVGSPQWHNAVGAVGASTFGNGTTGIKGFIAESNSLIGTKANDLVGGTGTLALTNGNYVVNSSAWDRGGFLNAGASTFGDGQTGVHGKVSADNSLVGSAPNDGVGDDARIALPNGGYLIESLNYDHGIADAGAVSFGGLAGVRGDLFPTNSFFGAGDISNISDTFTTDGSIVIGRPASNRVTLFLTDATPPSFNNAPPDITVSAPPGETSAVVTYENPPAIEDVGTATVVCTPPSGSTFQLGETEVFCTATNTEGLFASTEFTITVVLGADYIPLAPSRIVDTRPDHTTVDGFNAGGGQLEGGSTLAVLVANRGGVPKKSVAATLNVTVTEAAAPGYLTVYPCDEERPTASNLNYGAGTTIPNAVISKLDATGLVCVYASQPLQLIIDVNGAFPLETTYEPINPARLLDTRPGNSTSDGQQQGGGAVAAGSVTTLTVTGRAGIPADAAAVVLNVTITEPSGAGYATVYPCGTEPPTASNLNYTPGLTIPNLAIAKLGTDGTVCIYSQQGTHLIADVNGYFPVDTTYSPLVPARLLDTRPAATTIDGLGTGAGQVPLGTVTVVHVLGRGGVPANASTAVLNVTVTEPTAPGYVTVYPCGIEPPLASNLNFVTGQTIPNAVLTKIGTNGDVCIFNSQATHLVADVTGFFP